MSTQHIATLFFQHLQAPAKRSQHFNATYRNIVGPVFTSPGHTFGINMSTQHIATLFFQHLQAPAKRSQHLNATYRNIVGRNMFRAFGHLVVKFCDMLGVVGPSLKMVKFEPTTPDYSQQDGQMFATCCAQGRPTMLRYVLIGRVRTRAWNSIELSVQYTFLTYDLKFQPISQLSVNFTDHGS